MGPQSNQKRDTTASKGPCLGKTFQRKWVKGDNEENPAFWCKSVGSFITGSLAIGYAVNRGWFIQSGII